MELCSLCDIIRALINRDSRCLSGSVASVSDPDQWRYCFLLSNGYFEKEDTNIDTEDH